MYLGVSKNEQTTSNDLNKIFIAISFQIISMRIVMNKRSQKMQVKDFKRFHFIYKLVWR